MCALEKYLVLQNSSGADDSFKDVLAHMGVHSRQGVVEQVDISPPVDGTGQADSLLLSS